MSITTIIIYVASMLTAAIILNLGGWWATVRLFDKLGSRLRLAPFIAVRHLRGRKSGFLTAIGVLSILGVSFSSCTLTTVLSVMGGFSGDLKEKILKTNAHVVVDNFGADMEDWKPVIEAVRKVEGVEAATPLLQGEMMMHARTNNHGVIFKGIDLGSFAQVSGALKSLEKGKLEYLKDPSLLFAKIRDKRKRLYGDLDKRNKADGGVDDKKPMSAGIPAPALSPRQRVLPPIVVGRELSRSLRLYVGGEVNVINPLGGIGPTGPIPKSRPFRVGGVFFSGMYEFDNAFAYTSLKAAQKFMSKQGCITEIQIAVGDPDEARSIAGRIENALGGKWRVRSWEGLNAALFSALKLEKIVMFIILSMAILVASFCIMATLTMLVFEKGAEVSVLMTLGSSSSEIQSIFRFEGLLIGLVGTVSGLLVGFGLCMMLSTVGLPIDPEVWYIEELPVKLEWTEFLSVGLASLVITQIATFYPARVAAKLTPVEGLKNG
ncbi:MAG: ABC transporter permease [Deltaproteobacteria bacterium]|nr:ABC transporter permease [Deltaproteobacteria bacterium]